MIQFIEANGIFINLANVIEASISLKEGTKTNEHILTLTTVQGMALDYEGDDAEAIMQALNLLTMETEGARRQLALNVEALTQQATAVQQGAVPQ